MALFDYADKIALKQLIDNAKALFANKTEVDTSISNINKSLDKKGEVKTINTLLPDEDGNVQVTAESIGAIPDDVDILTFAISDETLVIGNAKLVNAEGVEF